VLNISQNHLRLDPCPEALSALLLSGKIKKLDITFNRFDSSGLQHLLEVYNAESHCMEFLNLISCAVDDDGCGHIAKVLEANANLYDVDLVDNQIGNAGLERLAEALNANTKLRRLVAPYNRGVSDLGA
jgi:Ran GTPase-activating protein (RanGAP) involved in mRNA processing and transport